MHGWGHQYVHNHAATNGVAMYLSALVLEKETARIKFENASNAQIADKIEKIKSSGMIICERALKILEHVVDGSLEEGVSYGSYTARALYTYMHLAKRHMNKDFAHHPWLTRQA